MQDHVITWLLEDDNPSVKYRAFTELLDRPQDSPEVQTVKTQIPESKAVRKILTKMHPDGYWLHRGLGMDLRYAMSSSTHFVLAFLAELGLDNTDERVARTVERYLNLQKEDGDFGNHQSCLYPYNLRTFVRLGLRDHPNVRKTKMLLLQYGRRDGGYLCDRPAFKATTKSCIRGTIKALSAFACFPELWTSEPCQHLVQYFLDRKVLFRRDDPTKLVRGELTALVFPFVIGGNLLEPLLALSIMGYGRHPALDLAWQILNNKRDEERKYRLDWSPPTTFNPGKKNEPNKWTTLYARLALKYREQNLI